MKLSVRIKQTLFSRKCVDICDNNVQYRNFPTIRYAKESSFYYARMLITIIIRVRYVETVKEKKMLCGCDIISIKIDEAEEELNKIG